jgi:NAD(P)-dependent dehydrogenase (short-subunit alcohol dehydrogenase family)
MGGIKMATVLITGSNRGLGLEFCRQYAEQGWHVIACARNPDDAFDLNKLAGRHSNVQLESLDVADFSQIDALSWKLEEQPIDVLINNAGIYPDCGSNGFGKLDYQAWTNAFIINTEAPLKMAEAFLPQLMRGNKKLIANVSSLMGSMADNGSGGSIFYRSSKAALNAAMKTLAIDLKNQSVGVLIFHPGWVKTDMGGPNALIDTETSIAGMRKLIDNFSLDQTGSFVKYDGMPMPW